LLLWERIRRLERLIAGLCTYCGKTQVRPPMATRPRQCLPCRGEQNDWKIRNYLKSQQRADGHLQMKKAARAKAMMS